MEDQDLIEQAVKLRDSGHTWWNANMQGVVMRDCGECIERCKRLAEAVNAVPLPTFTLGQLAKMYNAGDIFGFTYTRPGEHVLVRYTDSRDVRGTMIEDPDAAGGKS